MPSAANAKCEKAAPAEATDNSPIRQILTIVEHKIRNLEKRKSKLTSYRDLQKAGKELKPDQKVAVDKFDEVSQTLEFARDLSKQITGIVTSAEREAKKQAKRDTWVRYASDCAKIREVLLVLDCLMQMGTPEVREDFLNGANGANKLTEADLKILDDLYPEVTPKHEVNEEGQPGFHNQASKAAEHLYNIIDGKPKEILGTTYTHIKEIVTSVHDSGYFDKVFNGVEVEAEEVVVEVVSEEVVEEVEELPPPLPPPAAELYALPVPPAPAVVPAPAYPLRAMPPITLQEVEHAYFSQQYPQQRPISEVIGSQNFFFLQESELDSPAGTPQPMGQPSPPTIPSQTFTNQHFVQIGGAHVPEGAMPLPPGHYPHPEHVGFPPVPLPPAHLAPVVAPHHSPLPVPPPAPAHHIPPQQIEQNPPRPADEKDDDDWQEQSPSRDEHADRKPHAQGDGQSRFRRYGRGGGSGRGAPNGYRGRGSFRQNNSDGYHNNRHDGDYQSRPKDDYQGRPKDDYQRRPNRDDYQGRQNKDDYQGRQNKDDDYQGRSNKDSYHSRSKDGYQSRQYSDRSDYQSRHKDGYQNRNEGYYGNGDTGNGHGPSERESNGGRGDRYSEGGAGYGGGFKSRGRGAGGRGAAGGGRARPAHFARKPEPAE